MTPDSLSLARQSGDIESYVPHRGDMSWLDRLVSADDEQVVAEAVVRQDALFIEEGGLPAWTGIEFMAQAVAAWAGHRAALQGRPPRVGFLLGSRRYEAVQPFFTPGQTLRILARRELMGDNGLGMFSCEIHVEGRLAASAQVSVFEPPQAQAGSSHLSEAQP